MSSELRLRIMSAIVLAAITLAATWYGGLAFRLISGALGLLVFYEWTRITKLADTNPAGHAWGWFAIAVISGNVMFGEPTLDVPLLVGFVVTAAIFPPLRGPNWWLVGGMLYASLTAISLASIRGSEITGLGAMIFIFAIVWATDILAYFVGRAIGGPKLAPSISPGKTWSGAIGGTFFGVLAGAIVAYFFFGSISLALVAIALLLSIVSQIGDLFESYIKRKFKVKDSSHLIPGHGGFMDRVDGLVFACFAVFIIALVGTLIEGDLPGRIGSSYQFG
jgi:phosphatidate cytidylyltransferase